MGTQGHKPANLDPVDVHAELAEAVLYRHNAGHSETDIRSAAWHFFTRSGLVSPGEITQEESPTQAAAGRVDLVARGAFFEFKRNLYSGSVIDPQHINQLDNYLT